MWDVFMSRLSDTGLKELTLPQFTGDVTGGDAMTELFDSSINSLTILQLAQNANWWKSGDLIQQLLVFLGRQTHLKEFAFNENDLTTSQTTQLLLCITESNKQKLEGLGLCGSCNFDSDESVQVLVQYID